jgi:hypothetical protein
VGSGLGGSSGGCGQEAPAALRASSGLGAGGEECEEIFLFKKSLGDFY